MLTFAFGLRQALHPGKGSTWGPILLGVSGLSLIGAAAFTTDPSLGYPPGAPATQSLHWGLHLLVSNLSIISVIAACIVLARRFAENPGWRAWAVYSIATVVLVVVLTIATTLVSSPDPGSPFGLFQRLTIFVTLSWIALVALRLLSSRLPAGR